MSILIVLYNFQSILKNRTGKKEIGLVNNGCYFRFQYPGTCRKEKGKSENFLPTWSLLAGKENNKRNFLDSI